MITRFKSSKFKALSIVVSTVSAFSIGYIIKRKNVKICNMQRIYTRVERLVIRRRKMGTVILTAVNKKETVILVNDAAAYRRFWKIENERGERVWGITKSQSKRMYKQTGSL